MRWCPVARARFTASYNRLKAFGRDAILWPFPRNWDRCVHRNSSLLQMINRSTPTIHRLSVGFHANNLISSDCMSRHRIHRSKRHALLPSFLLPPPVFRSSYALIWAEQMDSKDANAMLSSWSFLHGPACLDTLHLRRSTVFFYCSKRKCRRTVACIHKIIRCICISMSI